MVYTFKLLRKCKYFRKREEHKIKQLKTVPYSNLLSADWLSMEALCCKTFSVLLCIKCHTEFWSIPSNVLWVLDVFCKPLGFKQISQVSVKSSVNVNGNDFIDVDLDYVTVEKKLCI